VEAHRVDARATNACGWCATAVQRETGEGGQGLAAWAVMRHCGVTQASPRPHGSLLP
jgi:hypothetical protein